MEGKYRKYTRPCGIWEVARQLFSLFLPGLHCLLSVPFLSIGFTLSETKVKGGEREPA